MRAMHTYSPPRRGPLALVAAVLCIVVTAVGLLCALELARWSLRALSSVQPLSRQAVGLAWAYALVFTVVIVLLLAAAALILAIADAAAAASRASQRDSVNYSQRLARFDRYAARENRPV